MHHLLHLLCSFFQHLSWTCTRFINKTELCLPSISLHYIHFEPIKTLWVIFGNINRYILLSSVTLATVCHIHYTLFEKRCSFNLVSSLSALKSFLRNWFFQLLMPFWPNLNLRYASQLTLWTTTTWIKQLLYSLLYIKLRLYHTFLKLLSNALNQSRSLDWEFENLFLGIKQSSTNMMSQKV